MQDKIILHTPSEEKVCKAWNNNKINSKDALLIDSLYEQGSRLTLVGIPNLQDNTLSVGLSICSYPDNFNKKIGIELATKRAIENPLLKWDMSKVDVTSYKYCLSALQQLHALVASNVNHYKRKLNVKL